MQESFSPPVGLGAALVTEGKGTALDVGTTSLVDTDGGGLSTATDDEITLEDKVLMARDEELMADVDESLMEGDEGLTSKADEELAVEDEELIAEDENEEDGGRTGVGNEMGEVGRTPIVVATVTYVEEDVGTVEITADVSAKVDSSMTGLGDDGRMTELVSVPALALTVAVDVSRVATKELVATEDVVENDADVIALYTTVLDVSTVADDVKYTEVEDG